MKIRYIILILTFISTISFSQIPQGSWGVDPDPFLESEQITLTVSGINSGNLSGVDDIYLWIWYTKFGGGSTNPDSEWNADSSDLTFLHTCQCYHYHSKSNWPTPIFIDCAQISSCLSDSHWPAPEYLRSHSDKFMAS